MRWILDHAETIQEKDLERVIVLGLSDDFFRVSDEEIKRIESVLTVVGGKIVYGSLDFQKLSPPAHKSSPDWAPHNYNGGYYNASNHGGGGTGLHVP
ncbi:hypothetical protein [Paenibacillus sp. Soil724D2]|uniref:hypothetical protein n=1 Tax=Paenibacillus sp. (strain Soil724D2) TaxID=1736392 RepID=UPI000761BF3E|nr:hypothetical protein [Paenibacillus sp. Soil724D2]